MKKKKQIPVKVDKAEVQIKDFFDMIAPSAVKFFADYFIFGDTYRCVWAIREYPPMTTDQAILSRFGDKENVTLHIYSRYVDNAEQHKILQNAQRKNTMLSTSTDLQESINAEGNIEDVVTLLNEMRRTKEPLLHCAVFIELSAYGLEKLKELQTEVSMELTREKISVDRLTLRQKEGFMAISPTGYNALDKQFERVLPASSVANLYPFNYSGKTDANGFYIGKDRYGTNILVDFDKREDDKTNSNILILGNSGQGKSFLMKLLLTNLREAGKSVISLDAEQEYEDLCNNLGGCYIDLMSGKYISTYIWVLTKGKEMNRGGKVQLIDASKCFVKRRKNIGNKRVDLNDNCIALILKAYENFEDGLFEDGDLVVESKIFDKDFFGFTKVSVETPLCDESGKPVLKKGKMQPDKSKSDNEIIPLQDDIDEYMKKNVLPYNPLAYLDRSKDKVGYEVPFTRLFYKFVAPVPSDDIFAEIKELEAEENVLMNELFHKE